MNLTKHWAAVLDDYVIDLAWSPDGTQLAAAAASGPVSIFQSLNGARLHELPGHDNGTNCLAWRPSPPKGDREQKTEARGHICRPPLSVPSLLGAGSPRSVANPVRYSRAA